MTNKPVFGHTTKAFNAEAAEAAEENRINGTYFVGKPGARHTKLGEKAQTVKQTCLINTILNACQNRSPFTMWHTGTTISTDKILDPRDAGRG